MQSSTRSRSERTRAAGALVLVALLVLPHGAWALDVGAGDTEARARQHFSDGTLAYDLGEFHKALKEYSEAYRLSPRPALLFNVAQCHRQLGEYGRAAFFYRRYLYLAGDAPDAGLARDLLAEVEPRANTDAQRPAGLAADVPVHNAKARPADAPLAKPGDFKAQGSEQAAARGGNKPAPSAKPGTQVAPVKGQALALAEPAQARARGARANQALQPSAVPAVKQDVPLTHRWWLWAGVGAAALLTGGIVYAATAPGARPTTLGTVPGH